MCFFFIERMTKLLAVGGCSREQVSGSFLLPPLHPLAAEGIPVVFMTGPLQATVFSSTLVSIAVIQELIQPEIEECSVPRL
jgi:hypothetical protein